MTCALQVGPIPDQLIQDIIMQGMESFPISSCNSWGLPGLGLTRPSFGECPFLSVPAAFRSCFAKADLEAAEVARKKTYDMHGIMPLSLFQGPELFNYGV